MDITTVLLVALALGTDAFSLAVGIGMAGIRLRRIILLSVVVSLFHILMPLTGLMLGSLLGRAIGQLAVYVGAAILILIGVQMFRYALRQTLSKQGTYRAKVRAAPITFQVAKGWWGVIALGASVSMDALSVGFGLGTMRVNLAMTVLVMGLVAGLMTAAGLLFGRQIGRVLEEKAALLGGIILIGIGIKLLF